MSAGEGGARVLRETYLEPGPSPGIRGAATAAVVQMRLARESATLASRSQAFQCCSHGGRTMHAKIQMPWLASWLLLGLWSVGVFAAPHDDRTLTGAVVGR